MLQIYVMVIYSILCRIGRMKMANEEKELHKFVYNPKYREKVIARVHKEETNNIIRE